MLIRDSLVELRKCFPCEEEGRDWVRSEIFVIVHSNYTANVATVVSILCRFAVEAGADLLSQTKD